MLRLPPALLVVAAIGVSLLAADVASAAKLDVARRVDPSLDSYLRTELAATPLSAMTADQTWLSSHSSPLVAHDSDPTVSFNLLGWATKPKVAVYLNATGVNPQRPAQLAETKGFLLSVKGKPVMVDGWRAFDVTKPAARTWWLYGADGKASCNPNRDERGALDLLACGYSSLWLDNALTTPKQGFTPTPKIAEKAWAKGMLTMLKQLRAKKPAGTTFTINMHWTDTSFGYAAKPKLKSSQPQIRAAQLADQVIMEGGAIDPGLHYALAAKIPWSYPRLLNFADAMHAQKVKLQWEKTGSSDLTKSRSPIKGSPKLAATPECRDGAGARWKAGDAKWKAHVRTAAFNYASALLTYGAGDSVGDMCEYPGRGWRGYEADLGTALAKRGVRGKLIIRKFSGGMVAVNPSDKSVRFAIGRGGVDLASQVYPVSNKAVTAVRLAPRTAAVVKYAAPPR
jgi:hypothetical protein